MPLYLGKTLISGQSRPVDETVTQDSLNLVTSGAVKTYVDEIVEDLATEIPIQDQEPTEGNLWIDTSEDGVSIAQSDWSQNDETALDYVKNRTHWTEANLIPSIDNVTLQFPSEEERDWIELPVEYFNVYDYDTYCVIWDGVEYKCSLRVTDDGIAVLGGHADGYPFHLVGASDWCNVYAYNEDGDYDYNSTHTLAVSAMIETIHKLDSKYLPDDCFMQPDWNQNDEAASDYVKNRTHWVENEIVPFTSGGIVFENRTETFEDGAAKSIVVANADGLETFKFTEGVDYIVVWDGVEYTCRPDDNMGALGYFGGNYPFRIHADHYSVGVFAEDSDGNEETGTTIHTFSIYEATETVHKLDPKFIPGMTITFDSEWIPSTGEDVYTADKTFEEIYSAYSAGVDVKLTDYWGQQVFTLVCCDSWSAVFISALSGTIYMVTIDGDNNVTYETFSLGGQGDASAEIAEHNSATDAHSDIRTLVSNAQTAATNAATAAANAQNTANSKAPMYDYGTTDLEAGVSALEHGKLYFVYE